LSTHHGDNAIFQNGRQTILNFRNRKVAGFAGSRRITVPNFVKIGQSIADILRSFDFSRWSLPPSWIFEIAKFY